MKISLSIIVLVVAATQINAAVTPNAASTCISGSSGKGQGDGYKGYCCKDQSDCLDDCVKGVCVGPVKPTSTKSSTTTATPTPGACTPGSSGLGQGDGYKGACCKDQSDCLDDCVKGVCNGPVNTKTTITSSVTKTTSTTVPTTTVAPGTCTPGSSGLGKGDGYKGACCKDQSDCIDDCVKGVCNGPVNTKTTITSSVTKTTSTTVPTTTVAPGTCTPGSSGLGKGDGYKGACCKDQSDCIDDCVKGVCNGPVNTKTTVTTSVTKTTTTAPTTTVAPGTCTPGSSGLGKGDGYKGACCKDQSDCIDDCVKGVCVGPVNTKTTTATATPTTGACIPGFFGKGNGQGGDNACCKDQSDCKESCLSGKCGVA